MVDNPGRPVPIPSTCQTVHGVFTTEPLGDDDAWQLPPSALLRRFGATDDDLARLADRPHARLVHRSATTDDAAAMMLAVRLESLALAEAHDGIVLDLAIPRIVDHPASATSLAVARQWIAFDLDGGDVRSVGLDAFGLPDLLVRGVETAATASVLAVLTGLAHRLLAEWPANDPVGPATVTLRDIAQGYGDPEASTAPVEHSLALGIDLAGDDLLVTFMDNPEALFTP